MDNPVLCVDIGTSSLKAALIGSSGSVVLFSRQVFPNHKNYLTSQEWIKALSKAVNDFTENKAADKIITKRKKLAPLCVCISGNGPTIVAPTGETLLWNDTIENRVFTDSKKSPPARTDSTESPAIKNSVDIKDKPITAPRSLFIPRLDLFRKKFDYAWKNSSTVFSGPEYIIYKLTGAAVTILPESRYRQTYWTDEELEKSGFSKNETLKLPRFVFPSYCAGIVTEEASLSTGIEAGTPVFCGGPDFISALIGTNTLHPGDLCDRAGTSEGLNLCTPSPLAGKEFRTLPSVQSGIWCCDYLIKDSGAKLAAAEKKEQAKEAGLRKISTCLNSAEPDLNDVMLELAKETAAGINKLCCAARNAGFPVPNQIFLTGGQANNEKLMQLKADKSNLPVVISACSDAELAGDNIIARTGLGEYSSISEAAAALVKPMRQYTPRANYQK